MFLSKYESAVKDNLVKVICQDITNV